jgi:hypothetical protein
MGTAFERPAPELVEVGDTYEFFANYATCEPLPDGNVLICFALERGRVAEIKATMVMSPDALARIGRQFLQAAGVAHNSQTLMRIVCSRGGH